MFNVSEIFHSVQGEGTRAGRPCTFVRLQGCTLRCSWCDTPYALDGRVHENDMTADEILDRIKAIGCDFVEFTGGEPLEQEEVFPLMTLLCDAGYEVAVETGGHIDVSPVDARVIKILDVKCPDSKMDSLNRYENLELLTDRDEVKFVLASREDYDWARKVIEKFELESAKAEILMSPVFDKLEYRTLVEWILADGLDVRFQMQMHKYIWEPDRRGV